MISKDKDNDRGLIIFAYSLLPLLPSPFFSTSLSFSLSSNNLCPKIFIYNSKCILISENGLTIFNWGCEIFLLFSSASWWVWGRLFINWHPIILIPLFFFYLWLPSSDHCKISCFSGPAIIIACSVLCGLQNFLADESFVLSVTKK